MNETENGNEEKFSSRNDTNYKSILCGCENECIIHSNINLSNTFLFDEKMRVDKMLIVLIFLMVK